MKFTQKNSFCIQGRCSARTCRYCYPWLRKYWDTFGSADKHPLSWASQVSPLCQPNLSPGASWTFHSPATKGLKSRSAGPPDFAPDWQPESNVIHHLLISYLLRPYIFFESFSLPPPLHSWPSEQRGLFSQSLFLFPFCSEHIPIRSPIQSFQHHSFCRGHQWTFTLPNPKIGSQKKQTRNPKDQFYIFTLFGLLAAFDRVNHFLSLNASYIFLTTFLIYDAPITEFSSFPSVCLFF